MSNLTLLPACYLRPMSHWKLYFKCLAELLCNLNLICVYFWHSNCFSKYFWHLDFGTFKCYS